MAVPFVSMDLFALATVPTGPDKAKGTATYKLLRATGQPLAVGVATLTFVMVLATDTPEQLDGSDASGE